MAFAPQLTDIPCIIHIQGIILPITNTYLPYGISNLKSAIIDPVCFIKGISIWHKKLIFEKKAKREYQFFKNIHYFIGRTDWDRSISQFLSPQSKYFHVDEILRDIFYIPSKWKHPEEKKIKIVSTLSDTPYKGLDLALKTAKILTKEGVDFEWDIIGVQKNTPLSKLIKKELKTDFESNYINLVGVKNSHEIREILESSMFYIHTSSIDNSPNSICEAQIMGIPCISTNAGGIPTLIKNGVTGFLVSINDPYYLASKIVELSKEKDLLTKVSLNAREVAMARHSQTNILPQLIDAYTSIIRK